MEKFHSRTSGGAYAEVVLVTCLCERKHDGNYARSMGWIVGDPKVRLQTSIDIVMEPNSSPELDWNVDTTWG